MGGNKSVKIWNWCLQKIAKSRSRTIHADVKIDYQTTLESNAFALRKDSLRNPWGEECAN